MAKLELEKAICEAYGLDPECEARVAEMVSVTWKNKASVVEISFDAEGLEALIRECQEATDGED